MPLCTREKRTPYCGKLGCEWPRSMNVVDLYNKEFAKHGVIRIGPMVRQLTPRPEEVW